MVLNERDQQPLQAVGGGCAGQSGEGCLGGETVPRRCHNGCSSM